VAERFKAPVLKTRKDVILCPLLSLKVPSYPHFWGLASLPLPAKLNPFLIFGCQLGANFLGQLRQPPNCDLAHRPRCCSIPRCTATSRSIPG
jgi:hypothetical protein